LPAVQSNENYGADPEVGAIVGSIQCANARHLPNSIVRLR
jgi:hypothetical protein